MAKGKERELRRGPRASAGLAPHTKHGLTVVFLFALSFILVLSFFGLAGLVGGYIKQALLISLGRVGYAVPVVLLLVAYVFLVKEQVFSVRQIVGFALLLVGVTALVHSGIAPVEWRAAAALGEGGGYLGYGVLYPLSQALGRWGAVVLLVAASVGGILILFETSLSALYLRVLGPLKGLLGGFKRLTEFKSSSADSSVRPTEPTASRVNESEWQRAEAASFGRRQVPSSAATKEAEPEQPPLMEIRKTRAPKVEIPLELLEQHDGEPTAGNISANQEKIQKTLSNFGIEVEMGSVNVGPTVTQYTLKPAEGVKLASITALTNDLALALAAHPIRIEAPIPGQSLVGIEVPNQAVAIVSLKEILTSEEFKHRKSNLTVVLGKDVAGRAMTADIDRMPHLLIAGATGSGKSVCINGIILSLLYTNSPDELKFIIVDPKRVELASYNDVPHLLTPVITEVPKTINALKWVVGEMDRRYQVLSKAQKR
ncbi:MAG: DNA translocase FtsK 4TM domain-containing protein, partial [Candidatus Veblenbacteria bacterium]|nr:DNA translocase FtsK 4TM domain-containing protein [Candidatus Veblenbacteria bacterium]